MVDNFSALDLGLGSRSLKIPFTFKKMELDSEAQMPFTQLFQLNSKWNVTPLLLGGSNFYFFTDLYCARIGLNARFALLTKEGGKERAFRPIRMQYIGL